MANRNNLPVLVFDFDDTLINTTTKDGNTHPLAFAYSAASMSQKLLNPVYDVHTRLKILEKYHVELYTQTGKPIDLTPLLNQHLINKVLIPAARLRDQGKIGAILILSNTALKTQLTWFDQYMLDNTGSVGKFGVLRKGGQANNSKPFNNGKARPWQYVGTSIIDWEDDKQYFFDYIMERNNRVRGDLTFVNATKPGCFGLSCTGSTSQYDWTRKTIHHVTHMTKKLGIPTPTNVFFFDDLSPKHSFYHPIAGDLNKKYVHILSKEPEGEVRDGYGVVDTYDNTGISIKPYEDATVYPQALLTLFAEANQANVSVNLPSPEKVQNLTVGGKRRRITKHKKTLKRRQARSRRRL